MCETRSITIVMTELSPNRLQRCYDINVFSASPFPGTDGKSFKVLHGGVSIQFIG